MKYQVVGFLHRLGVHGLCREVTEKVDLLVSASMRLKDGTLWTPDFNGIAPMTTRCYHVPRL